jgi:REP element-mobilizing transposase RayT
LNGSSASRPPAWTEECGVYEAKIQLNVSYVHYFNNKYKIVGHFFQDRFRSEVVEDNSYIITLSRYIHQNPVKSGIVKSVDEYKWSSYDGYLNENN